MRTKFLLTNILLLWRSTRSDGARADSATGATNIIIGSTPVSGTAGLLFSDGAYVQSLREPIRWLRLYRKYFHSQQWRLFRVAIRWEQEHGAADHYDYKLGL